MSKPRELTIKFLRSAERTVHELELHLAKAGFDASTIEIESEWAKSKGYVNDERVVERTIEQFQVQSQIGLVKAEQKLAKRLGQEPGEILGGRKDLDAAEVNLALDLAKRLAVQGKSAGQVGRRLSGKGFTEDAIRFALETAFPEQEW